MSKSAHALALASLAIERDDFPDRPAVVSRQLTVALAHLAAAYAHHEHLYRGLPFIQALSGVRRRLPKALTAELAARP